MGQDVEEYVFYEKRRLKEKMEAMSAGEKKEFLLGERTVAKNRAGRLEEEVKKMNAFVVLVQAMEGELNK